MYNILIVDDEYLARNKLHFLLEWEKYGFHILGEAAGAAEAINFLKDHQVDIVFTDVSMPDMNGIELAHYIQQNHHEISVVIFSNYSDFDYVKGAFSANVIDYQLKHTVTESSMLETLQMIKNSKQNISSHSDILPVIEKEQKYRSMIRQAVLYGADEYQPCHAVIAAMEINNQKLSLQLYSQQEQNMLYQNLENTIAQLITEIKSSVILRDQERMILYLPFPFTKSQTDIMQSLSQYIRQINSAIYKFYNFELLWGISVLSSPDYSIHSCYLEACAMLNQCPSKSRNQAPFPQGSSLPIRLSISMEKRLLGAISDLNLAKTYQCLEELFAGITPTTKWTC